MLVLLKIEFKEAWLVIMNLVSCAESGVLTLDNHLFVMLVMSMIVIKLHAHSDLEV